MAESVTETHVFGQNSVSTPGTAEQITTTNYRATQVLLAAHVGNTGKVFYGGSDVDNSTQEGLSPGDSVTIDGRIFDASTVYIDVEGGNGGDGADWIIARAD